MATKMTLEEAHSIHRNFRILATITGIVILTGTISIHYIEKLSWVDSIYFSIVSLSTVGYGDITPQTDPGKIFVCVYLLLGIGILAAFANNIIRSAVARRVIHKSER